MCISAFVISYCIWDFIFSICALSSYFYKTLRLIKCTSKTSRRFLSRVDFVISILLWFTLNINVRVKCWNLWNYHEYVGKIIRRTFSLWLSYQLLWYSKSSRQKGRSHDLDPWPPFKRIPSLARCALCGSAFESVNDKTCLKQHIISTCFIVSYFGMVRKISANILRILHNVLVG